MKPTPMLDFWQKPENAGEPLAVFATTFAFESEFFEQSCLARFLEVSSVNEGTGSIEDIVAAVELEERLQHVRVTVVTDRSAPVQRTSLNWDLISCCVDRGLLHSKVVILLWEKAARVIIGSANLTAAGYRRQIELGLAADLGESCLLPTEALNEIADELASYLRLVPGYAADIAVFARAIRTLVLFRERIAQAPTRSSAVRVAFAPTNPDGGPLERLSSVWSGPQPLRAVHLSPFWDSKNQTALESVRKLLTGRPAAKRSQHVAVVLGPRGQVSFSHSLADTVDSVRELKSFGSELRLLHAKCLLVESDQWVAALVGSSNHTLAGLGLAKKRHREMNVWLGASRNSKEGQALLGLIQLGKRVPSDAEVAESADEDEEELPFLPSCFGLCRIRRAVSGELWEICLGIEMTMDMPDGWTAKLEGDLPVLSKKQWDAKGRPQIVVVPLAEEALPMYLVVEWKNVKVPWAVVADDPHSLPPGPVLQDLRAHHLLEALGRDQSVAQVVRAMLENKRPIKKKPGGITVDPLKRLEVRDSLLRKGRALAASLGAMERRLGRQAATLDSLHARLAGPLGPEFVAQKVVEAFESGQQTPAEAIFTIAELALSVGRVNWNDVTEHIDAASGKDLVLGTISRLEAFRVRIGAESRDLTSYASRAIKEARRCLTA